MNLSLEGRVAVVTGASKGIGAGIATTLAEAGATVVVNFSTGQKGADAVVSNIVAKGGKAIAVQGNVAKAAEVQQLFAVTKKEFGKLDILVNNAGVYSFAPIANLQEDEFHRQFNTNVLGSLLTIRESLQLFGPNGGTIINISSVGFRDTCAGCRTRSEEDPCEHRRTRRNRDRRSCCRGF
jgi:3-oxoacyl-[acyl-carrier protein] reductase